MYMTYTNLYHILASSQGQEGSYIRSLQRTHQRPPPTSPEDLPSLAVLDTTASSVDRDAANAQETTCKSG